MVCFSHDEPKCFISLCQADPQSTLDEPVTVVDGNPFCPFPTLISDPFWSQSLLWEEAPQPGDGAPQAGKDSCVHWVLLQGSWLPCPSREHPEGQPWHSTPPLHRAGSTTLHAGQGGDEGGGESDRKEGKEGPIWHPWWWAGKVKVILSFSLLPSWVLVLFLIYDFLINHNIDQRNELM